MKAVILSAGKGTRLGSLAEKIPKGMIKINDKPILEHIIDDLTREKFNEICIVVGHHADQIKNYFGTGENYGAKICYAYQKTQLGTADALKQTKSFVKDSPFLLHLGDAINPSALRNNIKNMLNDECGISLLVCSINNNRKKNVGNIEMINNFITKISEKKNLDSTNYFWAGVVFFKDNLIFQKLELLQKSHTGEYEITDAINELIQDGIKVKGLPCSISIDTGTQEGLNQAYEFMK